MKGLDSRFCPVQASIDRYCSEYDDNDAFNNEVDEVKEALMKRLDEKDIYNAMAEVIEDECLLETIARAFRNQHSGNRVSLIYADDILCGLYNAVERSVEKYAESEVKKAWDFRNQTPPEDNDDYR